MLQLPGFEQLWEVEMDVESHIAAQNRDMLDMVVPPPVAEAVLAHLPHIWLETRTVLVYNADEVLPNAVVRRLTAVEAYRRWGGAAMEEALEKRWWDLPKHGKGQGRRDK